MIAETAQIIFKYTCSLLLIASGVPSIATESPAAPEAGDDSFDIVSGIRSFGWVPA